MTERHIEIRQWSSGDYEFKLSAALKETLEEAFPQAKEEWKAHDDGDFSILMPEAQAETLIKWIRMHSLQ